MRMIFKGEMNKKLLPPCWLTPRCSQLSPAQHFAIGFSDQVSFEKISMGPESNFQHGQQSCMILI